MSREKTARLSVPADNQGVLTLPSETVSATAARVTRLDRAVCRQLLRALENPPLALALWSGETIAPEGIAPIARAVFRDRGALYKLISHPNLHFGDLYSAGRIEIEGDFVQFLESVYRGFTNSRRLLRVRKIHDRLFNRPRANTLTHSRHNIHHHYDLGNAFYELWLDREAMQYTCAYYPRAEMTLDQAQRAKLDHICRKLQLKAGDRVVECGCGWGGLARHMAKHYGARVRAFNISHEQIAYARERAKAQGLADRVEYIEDDYRNASGSCDVFVSIGMLEHVGNAHYRDLGEVIDRCLTEAGRGLIHSIGRNRPEKMNAWVEKRIFPGAYPPTLREMMDIFEPFDFSVLDVENLRMHYARTLTHWLERYESHAAEVERMFDTLFLRAWRLYLAGSIAAFTTGSLQLFQVVFARGANNDLPPSRAHIYS